MDEIYIYSGKYFELREAIEALGKLYYDMGQMKGEALIRPDTDYDPIRTQMEDAWKQIEQKLNNTFTPKKS